MTRYTRTERARHEWLELYAHALTVACPWCEQPVDAPCVNRATGEQIAAPAHHQRITRADEAAQRADERALADRRST
jgi:hypothetical protein